MNVSEEVVSQRAPDWSALEALLAEGKLQHDSEPHRGYEGEYIRRVKVLGQTVQILQSFDDTLGGNRVFTMSAFLVRQDEEKHLQQKGRKGLGNRPYTQVVLRMESMFDCYFIAHIRHIARDGQMMTKEYLWAKKLTDGCSFKTQKEGVFKSVWMVAMLAGGVVAAAESAYGICAGTDEHAA